MPKWSERESIFEVDASLVDLLSKLLHMGVILIIIKVLIILFLLCQWEHGTPWQFSKQISKLSFKLNLRIYFLLAQTERERKTFFWKGARRGSTSQDYPQEHLVVIRDKKVSPFLRFEIILTLLCFLLDPFTNKHCRTWSSMINLRIDSRTCQK